MKFIKELPRSGRDGKYDWSVISAELKAHPNEWGIVEGNERVKPTIDAAQGTARFIRSGKSAHMEPGAFEATTRKNIIYARYVGKDD